MGTISNSTFVGLDGVINDMGRRHVDYIDYIDDELVRRLDDAHRADPAAHHRPDGGPVRRDAPVGAPSLTGVGEPSDPLIRQGLNKRLHRSRTRTLESGVVVLTLTNPDA
ncbi:hypothetical protein [Ruania halotolerans]|uniref:hypothetical protein n=1 Tax=Ruania halotolerans TaxID=2897773 RepID=UPI001E623017|nr:hypothetical protein [Ruania halotolerans]UFU06233.1 hypothetical protein LQF10_17700 [Ruania halotolerans]